MKKIFYLVIPVFIVLLIWSILGGNDGNNAYIQSIKTHRIEKDKFFKTSEASPFVQKKTAYQPVSYYAPDPSYKVTAKLDRFTKRETVTITNSDGSSIKYLKFGRLKFDLKGQENTILVLKQLGFLNQYLVAFADETSGVNTYGGGRYLDLIIGKSDRIEVDFNKAYNPYCAYFGDFLCPLPPRENILNISIEAGEKDYESP
ncbi:MAG: DUF1684 domain-containing protein [Bacteroidota bacterium]